MVTNHKVYQKIVKKILMEKMMKELFTASFIGKIFILRRQVLLQKEARCLVE